MRGTECPRPVRFCPEQPRSPVRQAHREDSLCCARGVPILRRRESTQRGSGRQPPRRSSAPAARSVTMRRHDPRVRRPPRAIARWRHRCGGLRIPGLLAELQPRLIVGGTADGSDLLVLEAALAMDDPPCVHAVPADVRGGVSRASVRDEWRDRFDRVLAELRAGGRASVESLELDDGEVAYPAANVAFLDRAVERVRDGEPVMVLLVAAAGEGATGQDLVEVAASRGITTKTAASAAATMAPAPPAPAHLQPRTAGPGWPGSPSSATARWGGSSGTRATTGSPRCPTAGPSSSGWRPRWRGRARSPRWRSCSSTSTRSRHSTTPSATTAPTT